MARVLICDDAVAFSILFKRWMSVCGLEVDGPATTAVEAVSMAREHRPAVVVVDHLLGSSTSAELVPLLREVVPDAKVLLISSLPADRLAEVAADAAADGYLSKAARDDEMCHAVRALLP